MLKRLRFVATLVCLSLSFSIFAEEGLIFINNDLRAGLNRAASEGKLIFLEFHANYCTPCKMMEEYTFTNATVVQRMNSGYIPVKIDIQTFDGFDLKSQYKVKVLPTILILDSKGHLVARYEETMAPTQLNSVLDKHNLPKNRTRVAPTPVAYTNNINNNSGFNNSANRHVASASVAPVSNTPPSVAAPVTVRTSVPNSAPPRKVAGSTTPTASVSAAPRKILASTPTIMASELGQQKSIPSTGFTIQAGAYEQQTGVKNAVAELKPKSGSQKQFVMQSKGVNSGKVTYRIFVGNFATAQQAEEFRKKNAIEGYVRNFGDFNKK
jgi:cell division septation protein DedD